MDNGVPHGVLGPVLIYKKPRKGPMGESHCVQHLTDGKFEASQGSGWVVPLSSGYSP